MRKIYISPSFLSSNFTKVHDNIVELERAGADFVHCDVMDGVFVPKITFGCKMVSDIKQIVEQQNFMKLDVHLMISNPIKHIENFAKAGADIITIHYEADAKNIEKVYAEIKKYNKLAGLSIKPKTNVSEIAHLIPMFDLILIMSVEPGEGGQGFIEGSLDKIKDVRKIIDNVKKETGKDIYLEVDGGIKQNNAQEVIDAGANVLVSGSAIFNSPDFKEAISLLRGK